ncbi:UDP-glucose 4-epimerase GalE [Bradyrhizobium sp. 147]|uniref:UDP-glucose 4-epimerase GalE n=1 Tax=unclassified Bradyrhizobium TaxID=2631580 RepID=UPI001FFA5A4B|nr:MULTISPECIES: UDP-glucose 4-epimerase GalE [unclassified Bradyrhizobium]MCK1546412.1 UDP-glucose 4-epimerase GalE [Bradyrhizobium sp. 179]MCK1680076.1 UDP-glucose 4-epimerase GalE [Bradyrhizobium sp. 147]
MKKTVLVTGGAGYVGSHCCKAFAMAGWNVVTLDNLSRGWRDAVRWGPLVECDIRNSAGVRAVLETYKPDLVAHFAALAYVGESVADPAIYYDNNTRGTLALLEAMRAAGCLRVLFSSTCASYGVPKHTPIDETHPQAPINPYGWSKMIIERMLEDFGRAYEMSSVSLRYFNAAGCDPDGEIGERHEPETHAIPLAIEAVRRPHRPFTILGTDFPTPDGSAIRDYIHVNDLAQAHLLAGDMLVARGGTHVFNLGTGVGTSVLELVEAVKRVSGKEPVVSRGPRRAGDPPMLVASFAKAKRELGWSPRQSEIDFIIETALRWSDSNPSAYFARR